MGMRAQFLSILILGWFCLATVAFAQEAQLRIPPDSRYSTGTLTPATTLPTIVAREPGSPSDAILLSDGNGGFGIAVIGPTLTEFDEWKKRLFQSSPEPLYTIQSLSTEGKVADNIADLTIQLRIQTKNEPFIQIPIGLKNGIFPVETDWSRLVRYDGPSLFQIIPNPQGNGFDIILRAKPVESGTHASQSQPEPEVPETPATEPVTEPDAEKAETIPVTPPAGPPALPFPDDVIPGGPPDIQNPHLVTLRMNFPVSQLSVDEYQLKVDFPASLISRVQLVVPQPDAVVLQPKGGILRQTSPLDEQSTLFDFQGIPNDFEVQWQKKQRSQDQQRVVLQVEDGRVEARVSPAGVKFDATIPVKSPGGAFDSFTLQLPRGAVFLPLQTAETTEYQIEVPPPKPDAPDAPSHAPAQTLLFRLPEPTEGPVRVRVAAETPFSHSRDGWFEVGGFEVAGAEKQFGKLSVVVPQETRLRWQKESGNIRPSVDPAIMETEGIVSTFEYYEQPYSLSVQAVPQSPRVHLAPEYQVRIHRNRAVLQARLIYTVYGSLDRLALDMNGWRLTRIEPNKNIDRELPFMEDGPITIPLSEPVGQNIELNLQAEREFDFHDGLIRFPFPVPKADIVKPAMLAVVPDDNIELTFDESLPLVEMSPQSLRNTPLQIELPASQQGALVYRIDHPAKAEFLAKPVLHQQKITVQSHTELTLQTGDPVRQMLDYTVEYEPVTRLILAVPTELDSQTDLRVMLDSRELKLNDVTGNDRIDGTERDASRNPVVLKLLRLPEARIGTFQLALDFMLKTPMRDDFGNEQRPQTFPVRIPVVLPHDGRLIRETVHLRYPRGLQVNHAEDETGWKKMESPATSFPASQSGSVFQTEQADSLLLLGVILKNAELSGTTIVETGWVRHWLQDSGRTDCACYRVSTNLNHLTMTLPEHVRTDPVSVKVDGRHVTAERNGQNIRELRIPLPPPSRGTPPSVAMPSSPLWLDLPGNESLRTLEIRYEVPMNTSLNRLTLDMPAFAPEVIVRPVFCQVILPNTRHLLSCNAEWMPLYQWRFGGGFLSRKSELTRQELENRVGVSPTEPVSPALNSYLFIALQPESRVQLNLVDRSTLVLVSSGLILLFGLILIYFPRLRYPGVLFTFLVLFVAAFVYRVTLAVLFLQAGVIGFVLVLVASFLYRMFVSGDPWRAPIAGSLSASGWREHTRFDHPVISSDGERSDPARVKVMPAEQAEPESRVSGEERVLMKPGISGGQKNGDAVPDDVSGAISHPVSEKERGNHE